MAFNPLNKMVLLKIFLIVQIFLHIFVHNISALTLQQRQQQFMNIQTIVEDTAEHIVQGMKTAVPSHEWNEQHDTIVKGVLKQRDHIVQAFTEESFLEISRKNGIRKPSIHDKAKLFRGMLNKFDSHSVLVELATLAQSKTNANNKKVVSITIAHIAKMWSSFRKLMTTLAEFMYTHVAKETYVGVGVEGYLGWKGLLKSGVGPNLQFCWDATDVFNHMVYSDDEGKYEEVMKEYNDKRATDEVVEHGEELNTFLEEEQEYGQGNKFKRTDAVELIKNKKYVRKSLQEAMKGNINPHLKSKNHRHDLSDKKKHYRRVKEHEKEGQDMNKVIGRASRSLNIKDDGRESAVTLWDTVTGSIRNAWKKTKRFNEHVVNRSKIIATTCGKAKGLRVKICVNLNWRFPQPRPSPYVTLVLNREMVRCLANEGGHALVQAARKMHPIVNNSVTFIIKEMKWAQKAMSSFFKALPTLVDKNHHKTLKTLRSNEKDEEKNELAAKLSKFERDHHPGNDKQDKYLTGILKRSKERHAKYLSDKKCDDSFQWVFGLVPRPGKPAGIRYSARDCLHALKERLSSLGDLLKSGTNAFQNMLNIPSSSKDTKLLESDLKKDSSLLSKAFTHKVCDKVDIEHELTITLAAGMIKKAFNLFTYTAVGTHLSGGPNKKARDEEWDESHFLKDELLKEYTTDLDDHFETPEKPDTYVHKPLTRNGKPYVKFPAKSKKTRSEYVTQPTTEDELNLIQLNDKKASSMVPAAKIAKLRKLARLKKFFLGMVPDGIGLGTTLSIGPIHHAGKCIKHGLKKFILSLFTSVAVGECTKTCEIDADCNGQGSCDELPSFLLFGDDQKRCLNCKTAGNVCQMDSDCTSGVCDGGYLWGFVEGKCFTPLPEGGKCDANEQCISGDCDGHGMGLFWGKCDKRGNDLLMRLIEDDSA